MAPAIRFRFRLPQARPGDNLYTNPVVALDIERLACISSTRLTILGLRRERHPPVVRHHDQRREPQGRGAPDGATDSYTLDRTNGSAIRERAIRQRLELDRGIDPRPASRWNTIRSSTFSNTSPKPVRGDGMKRAV
jgi:hypothetical protein